MIICLPEATLFVGTSELIQIFQFLNQIPVAGKKDVKGSILISIWICASPKFFTSQSRKTVQFIFGVKVLYTSPHPEIHPTHPIHFKCLTYYWVSISDDTGADEENEKFEQIDEY